MLKHSAILVLVFLFLTAACAKSPAAADAAGDAAANSSAGNVAPPNSGKRSAEKVVVADPNRKVFRGRINGIEFEMTLARDGGALSGTYFYTKIKKDLKLSGTIDAAGKFNLKETDGNGKPTGKWSGTWHEDKNSNGIVVEGTWAKPQQAVEQGFSFYAVEQLNEFTGAAKFTDRTIQEIDKAKRSEISSVYPEISGIDAATAAKFNASVKDRIVAANDMYRKDLAEMTAEDIKDLPGEGEITLSNEIGYDVALANNDFVSLSFHNYTYMGGAHGSTSSWTINYDLKNNRELRLEDVFAPDADYLKTLSDYAIADLKLRLTEMSDEEWIARGAGAEAANFASWNLTKKGLMLTFDQYQVAAYAAGPQTVIVPYERLKNIVRKDVIAAALGK